MSCSEREQNYCCGCENQCPPTAGLAEGILQAQKSVRVMFNKHIPVLKDSEENESVKRQLIIDTGRQILNCAGLIAIRRNWSKGYDGGTYCFISNFTLTHVATGKSSDHQGSVLRNSETNEEAALDETLYLFLKGILLPC